MSDARASHKVPRSPQLAGGDTLEPFDVSSTFSTAVANVAVVDVLFHPDFSRIGDRFELSPALQQLSRPTPIGREAPPFRDAGGKATALLDPCISRFQAQLSWSPTNGTFTVVAEPGAKREAHLFDLTGRALPFVDEVPPGTLLAFGGRVLLHLGIRPATTGDALGLVGMSACLEAVRQRVRVLATLDDTVLVQGETGTGKELVCRALHLAGPRATEPFVALNCAALPEALIESELFGYEKGAFSGAVAPRRGLFQAAGAGTLFLDEIGELSLSTQAKLLRTLETRRVRPLGAHDEQPFSARVVAATHRDLAAEVEAGRFRADLYSRIEAPQIVVPPLRERREDIPLLLATFLRARAVDAARAAGQPLSETPIGALFAPADTHAPPVSLEYVLSLLSYDWPRNVRELGKVAAELGTSLLERAALPRAPMSRPPPAASRSSTMPPPSPAAALSDFAPPADGDGTSGRLRPSRTDLEAQLAAHAFNQTTVARELGVPYTTLDRWMRELGVRRPADLSVAEIESARVAEKGDLGAMARALKVSLRGLKSRLK